MYEDGRLGKVTGGFLRPGDWDMTRRMLASSGVSTDAFILDAGCGTGLTIEHLQTSGYAHVLGIDHSERILQAGRNRNSNLPLVCAPGQALPIENEQVDVILAECSFSAMSNDLAVLAEFQRVLCLGGYLLLSDVYARNPEGVPELRALPFNCGLREVITRQKLEFHLQQNNFEIQRWEDESETLKHLAGQIIMSCGSLNKFWDLPEPTANSTDILFAIRKAKLGYFFLVAKKVIDE